MQHHSPSIERIVSSTCRVTVRLFVVMLIVAAGFYFLSDQLTDMMRACQSRVLPGVQNDPNFDDELNKTESCYEVYERLRRLTPENHPSLPWLDLPNIRLLCQIWRPNQSVLEYGCGGSTVFFSRFVRKWRCIEHDKDWGMRVEDLLHSEPHRSHVEVDVVEPSEPYDQSKPGGSNDGTYKQFRGYIEYPASLDEKFDVIVDDGRARVPVGEAALRNHLLTEDGVLIIHDWERPHYKPLLSKGFNILTEDKESMRQLAVLVPSDTRLAVSRV